MISDLSYLEHILMGLGSSAEKPERKNEGAKIWYPILIKQGSFGTLVLHDLFVFGTRFCVERLELRACSVFGRLDIVQMKNGLNFDHHSKSEDWAFENGVRTKCRK